MSGIAKCLRVPIHVLCCCLFLGLHPFVGLAAKGGGLFPESLIYLNCDNPPNYALVVEKKSQTIRVYECDDGYRLRHRFPCSTGEVEGKKTRSGDRKTPEGVYFFTAVFEKKYLSSTYGNRAFVMDYPNLLDRMSNRRGDNIWLHGTNKRLKPRDTNGCVTVENGNIDILARYIRLNHTPIIIKEELRWVPPQVHEAEAESLKRFLENWKQTFLSGDRTDYATFYKNSPPDHNKVWEAWAPMRASWSRDALSFEMGLTDIAIARANPCLVVLLDQSLRLEGHVAKVGRKKLYVEAEPDGWKIMGETYQGAQLPEESQDALILSMKRLESLRRGHKDVAERVAEWADAWGSGDMDRYEACYGENFRAQGKDLAAWIAYKKGLNRRYDFITVSVEDLRIEQEGDRSTATFTQRYRSSGHESVGTKRLRLKRVGDEWKIVRERWFKTAR